jgi:hypothetical protein
MDPRAPSTSPSEAPDALETPANVRTLPVPLAQRARACEAIVIGFSDAPSAPLSIRADLLRVVRTTAAVDCV